MSAKTDHVVLVGYGRVGSVVGKTLLEDATPMVVIEDRPAGLKELREQGVEVLQGNAAAQGMLQAANVGAARALLVAIPDAFEGGQIVAKARAHQRGTADHRAGAFRAGDRAPQASRREYRHHGRRGNRQGDDRADDVSGDKSCHCEERFMRDEAIFDNRALLRLTCISGADRKGADALRTPLS